LSCWSDSGENRWRRTMKWRPMRTEVLPVRIGAALAHSSGVTRGLDPIGAKLRGCPGRCAAWSLKGVTPVFAGYGAMMRSRPGTVKDTAFATVHILSFGSA
jgi:hypothetical protein